MSPFKPLPKLGEKKAAAVATSIVQAEQTLSTVRESAKEYFVDAARDMPILPIWHMANTIPVYSIPELIRAGAMFNIQDEWREAPYILVDYDLREDEWVFKLKRSKQFSEYHELLYIVGNKLSARWDKDVHGWAFPAVMYNMRLVLETLQKKAEEYKKWENATWQGKPSRSQELFWYFSRVDFTPVCKSMMELKQAQEERWEKLTHNLGLGMETVGDFNSDKPLLKTQINGAEFLLSHDSVCGDDMGTGKTRIGLNVAWHLFRNKENKINRCLVICPASVVDVWRNQSREYLKNRVIPIIITGNWDERIKKSAAIYPAKRTDEDGTEFRPMPLYIVSYETARLHPVEMQNLCDDGVLILDEAHKIKDMSRQTATFVHNLRPVAKKALTGTPIMNTPIDAYSIMEFVRPGLLGRSYSEFFNHFAYQDGKYRIRYHRLDEMNQRIKPWFIRRLKAEVIDLPEKLWLRDFETIPMGEQQRKVYKDMADKYIAELETMDDTTYIVEANNVMTRILKLMQICDGYLTEGVGGRLEWITDAGKPKELREILKAQFTNNPHRKIVIWSRFLPPIMMMAQDLAEYHPVILHGGVPMEKRGSGPTSPIDTVVGKFHNDPNCRIFIGQIQTGGQGIDLTCADVCIFFDHWWAPGMNEQAEDRLHRIGQRNPVTIIPMVMDNSVDQYYFGFEFEGPGGEIEQGLLYQKKQWKKEAVDGQESFRPSRAQLLKWLRRA